LERSLAEPAVLAHRYIQDVKKDLPAETELKFKLAEDLQMRAVSGSSTAGLKNRTQ